MLSELKTMNTKTYGDITLFRYGWLNKGYNKEELIVSLILGAIISTVIILGIFVSWWIPITILSLLVISIGFKIWSNR